MYSGACEGNSGITTRNRAKMRDLQRKRVQDLLGVLFGRTGSESSETAIDEDEKCFQEWVLGVERMSGEIVLWRRRKEDFEAKEERRERERERGQRWRADFKG